MKKALLYSLTAVLLGAAMMILPQWIFWVSRQPLHAFGLAESFTDALSTSPKEWRFTQVPEQPSSEQTVSYKDVEIFLVGFVVALTVRFLYKRRAPYSTYRMSPF